MSDSLGNAVKSVGPSHPSWLGGSGAWENFKSEVQPAFREGLADAAETASATVGWAASTVTAFAGGRVKGTFS